MQICVFVCHQELHVLAIVGTGFLMKASRNPCRSLELVLFGCRRSTGISPCRIILTLQPCIYLYIIETFNVKEVAFSYLPERRIETFWPAKVADSTA